MKGKALKRFFSVLLITVTLFSSAVPAYANSAIRYEEGVSAAGVAMPDGESPIAVEKETLTFNIPTLPESYYSSSGAFAEYNASVTAEYTFYNPSDYNVTATLVFPFGKMPSYANYYYTADGERHAFYDTDKHNIMLGGAPIEKRVRYTHCIVDLFDLNTELPKIRDTFLSDGDYKPDTAVTRYRFKVVGESTDEGSDGLYYLAADIPADCGALTAYLPLEYSAETLDSGAVRVRINVKKETGVFELFVIGTPPASLPEWRLYKNRRTETGDEIPGTVSPESSEGMTLKDFLLSYRNEDSPVSETDWYNAAIEEFKYGREYSNGYKEVSVLGAFGDPSESLLRWYEYEITLAPGERITNTVTAPIYPDIDTGYKPSKFNYTYLLSPAKSFSSFGELEITVNTPFFMLESGIQGFTKSESGYTLKLSGLPDKEMTFTLSKSEKPHRDKNPAYLILGIILIAFCTLICVAILASVIIVMVKIRKKRREYDGHWNNKQ